jgi:hypothetical protein
MARVTAWHSSRPSDPAVYHDNDQCTEGNNIEARYRQSGTDKPAAVSAVRGASSTGPLIQVGAGGIEDHLPVWSCGFVLSDEPNAP